MPIANLIFSIVLGNEALEESQISTAAYIAGPLPFQINRRNCCRSSGDLEIPN